MLKRALIAAATAAVLLSSSAKAQGLQPVDLELVLAVDTSTSVDAREFNLQTQGLSEAFLHPEVVTAIRNAGGQGVAVTVVQWAGPASQATVLDWYVVRDAQTAATLAVRIAGTPRTIQGMTDISGAIRFSVNSIISNRYDGRRKVIDVSGDGSSNPASSELARNQANALGVTINGLVISNFDYSLGELANINLFEHYLNHVIGGPGAFLMTAKNYDDFRTAIRKKLVREITGPVSAGLSRP